MGVCKWIKTRKGELVEVNKYLTNPAYDYYPNILKRAITWREKDIKPNISVTLITGCLKDAYYKLTKGSTLDEDALLTLFLGNCLHKAMQPYSTFSEIYLEWKTGIAKCVGFADSLTIDASGTVLTDWKTVAFAAGKQKLLPDHWTLQNELQIKVYAQMLKQQNYFISKANLVYISLADKKVIQRQVNIDEDMSNYITSRTNQLALSIDLKHPPVGELSEGCKLCQWKNMCEEYKEANSSLIEVKSETAEFSA